MVKVCIPVLNKTVNLNSDVLHVLHPNLLRPIGRQVHWGLSVI